MDAENGSHTSGKHADEHPGTVLVKLYPNAVVNGAQVCSLCTVYMYSVSVSLVRSGIGTCRCATYSYQYLYMCAASRRRAGATCCAFRTCARSRSSCGRRRTRSASRSASASASPTRDSRAQPDSLALHFLHIAHVAHWLCESGLSAARASFFLHSVQPAAGVRHRVLAARVLRPRAGAQSPLPQLGRRHGQRAEQHGPVPSHAGALRAPRETQRCTVVCRI